MITTIKLELTWDGAAGKAMSTQSEKKIKKMLKDMTGAIDIEINDINSWDEDDSE